MLNARTSKLLPRSVLVSVKDWKLKTVSQALLCHNMIEGIHIQAHLTLKGTQNTFSSILNMHFSECTAFQTVYYSCKNVRKRPSCKWRYKERDAYLPCSLTHFVLAGVALIVMLFLLLLLSAVHLR